MRIGLLLSLLLHAALIGWGVANLDSFIPEEEEPRQVPIAVDIVDIAELSQVTEGVEEPKEEPATEQQAEQEQPIEQTKPEAEPKEAEQRPEPKEVAAVPPPPEAEAPPPTPEPEVQEATAEDPPPRERVAPSKAPSPLRNPRPRRDPPEVLEQIRVAEAARRERQRRNRRRTLNTDEQEWDSDNIAALLNKVPDASPAAASNPDEATALEPLEEVDPYAPRGQRGGFGDKLTISEFDFFTRQIGQCWNPPVGAANAQDLVPVIAFNLRDDGTVDGIPRVINSSSSPFFRTAAEAAIRAVKQCQPYNLPVEKYDDWAYNEITFDPRSMFGG